jgi:hypothetical protein
LPISEPGFNTVFLPAQGARYQWQGVFILSAAMYTVCLLSFMIFGSSEVQDWAKAKPIEGGRQQERSDEMESLAAV